MIGLGIVVATIASFIASAIIYAAPPVSALVGRASTARPGLPTAVQMASVLFRSLIASCLIAGLMVAANWEGLTAGAALGFALASLPAILLMGAVIHENTPIPVAAVHLLDWVVKLVLIGTIVGLFT